jgi:hypothetical protein
VSGKPRPVPPREPDLVDKFRERFPETARFYSRAEILGHIETMAARLATNARLDQLEVRE